MSAFFFLAFVWVHAVVGIDLPPDRRAIIKKKIYIKSMQSQTLAVHVRCKRVSVLTVHVADLAVLDCWKDTWKVCRPG